MGVSCRLQAPAALPLGKQHPTRYPLDRRPAGTQSRSGCGGEEETMPSLAMLGIEPRSFITYRNIRVIPCHYLRWCGLCSSL